MNNADYSQMTNEEFDQILLARAMNAGGAEIFGIEGVYEILSDYWNDEVIEEWAENNPEKAFPSRGWGVFESGERGHEIQRDDDAGKFESDEEAFAYVCDNPLDARQCISELLDMLNSLRRCDDNKT